MAAPLRRLHGHQTRDPRCNGHTISRVHLLPRLHVRSRHPLLTRAQTAGEARTDITFDDLIRMVAGITGATYPEPDQRDHILNIALDGVRTHRP